MKHEKVNSTSVRKQLNASFGKKKIKKRNQMEHNTPIRINLYKFTLDY